MSTIAQDAAGHQVGRLEHHRVAVAERRRDLPGRDGDREIPRRDDADDADRLAGDLDADARAHRGQRLARQPQRLAGEELEDLAGAHGLADALGQASCPPRATAAGRAPPCAPGSRRPPCAAARGARADRSATISGNAALAAAMAASVSCRRGPGIVADHLVGVGRVDVGHSLAVDPLAVDQVLVQCVGHVAAPGILCPYVRGQDPSRRRLRVEPKDGDRGGPVKGRSRRP